MRNEKIIIGLSGGVDSAVSAYLLKKQGLQVSALFMQNWEEDNNGKCSIAEDLEDAENVCEKLDIELQVVNFAREYWQKVFSRCLDDFAQGLTPNPDILCNSEIKFNSFLHYALSLGGTAIATGHYVRRQKIYDQYQLLKGLDPNKDQSYFLYKIPACQLQKTYFPVGEYKKSMVREIAKQQNLSNHAKKDSTGICFIGERKFANFLQQYLPAQTGEIHDIYGKKIGMHNGVFFYTIGQRSGLKIGGLHGNQHHEPWYVADKNIAHNILIVVQGAEHPLLFRSYLIADNLHWLSNYHKDELYKEKILHCSCKTRYRQSDIDCTVELNSKNDSVKVVFAVPQRAITPGQSVVFYDQNICLGGGIINRYET